MTNLFFVLDALLCLITIVVVVDLGGYDLIFRPSYSVVTWSKFTGLSLPNFWGIASIKYLFYFKYVYFLF